MEGEREYSQLMTMTMTAPRTRVDPGSMPSPPDPEVPEKAKRRRFSAEYKLAILREADACTQSGEVGALRSLSTRMRQPGLEFSESAPPPGAHCAWED